MKYKDIITYKLADGVSEAQLLAAAKPVVDGWMKKQKGFMGWEINRLADGSFLDLVYWENEACAKECEKNMRGEGKSADLALDPVLSGAWYGCYDMQSVKSVNGTSIFMVQNMGAC